MSKNSNKMGLHVGTPDDVEKIQWTKNFRLKLEHFQNETEIDDGKFGISLLPEYEIEMFGKQLTNYSITNLKIKNLFRPIDAKIDKNVWPEKDNYDALLFYQGAFDLSEEISRKAQTEIEQKIFRKTFSCKGRGKSERRKFAQEDAQKQITKLMAPFLKEFFLEQIQYEKDVNVPENFKINYSKYQPRFDRLREEISI
ncbi:MAG: hypothetical protein OEL52_07655 [Nitrosopumilus sp.]|nr:hypothetical protein [Nitrosopumilus sp.]